ncbi:MAG: hypothetical protein HYX85_00335 [Chloroflexi bacterium]|nr:hypothetical protein [Chloroflexota bacterium]
MSKPKWASPERQNYLIRLWVETGNKCLLGHDVCPIPEHYRLSVQQAHDVAVPVSVTIRDDAGNVRGTLDTHTIKRVVTHETREARLFDLKEETAIRYWIADDRQQDLAEWQQEVETLHRTNDRRYPLNGQFSGIGRDVFFDQQPEYYVLATGISGLTFKPFAKVRLPSSYVALHVDIDLSGANGISKSARRKAIRYGRISDKVQSAIRQAVEHYFRNR